MNIEEYVYENGVRVRMDKKKASGSDNGREEYAYNADGSLASTTVYLPGETLSKRIDYTYEDGLLKEAVPYKWDGANQVWTETNYIEAYGLKSYDAAFAPTLRIVKDAATYSTLHITVLPGIKTDGVTGYWLISDGRIDLETVYSESFDLTGVADGIHEYRVIPVDGSVCGLTASDAVSINVKEEPRPIDDTLRIETVQLFRAAYPDIDYAQERYFYDREGHVLISSKFAGATWDNPYYSYEYSTDGQVLRRNEHNISSGIGKPAKYVLYSYNDDGTLATENEFSVSTSTDKADTPVAAYAYTYTNGVMTEKLRKKAVNGVLEDFKIERYTYDAEGVLTKMERYDAKSDDNNPEATETYEYNDKGLLSVKTVDSAVSGTVTRWTYTYNDAGLLIQELPEQKVNGVWTIRGGDKREYSYKKYIADTAPTLKVEVDKNTFNTLKFTVTPGSEVVDDLQGYWLVTDGAIDCYVARRASFTLTGVADGIHTYRVIPADNSTCGLVASDAVTVNIDRPEPLDLPAPADLHMVMFERTISLWEVGIEWTAPKSTNAHLAGYRYVFGDTYNNGEFDADATNGIAKCMEDGLHVPLKLYAIYAEGESEPAVLDVDMTNWNAQITLHWKDSGSTLYDNNNNKLKSTSFYYDRQGNIAATVKYDADGKPVKRIRDISKNLRLEEKYDEAGKCWKQDIRVDISTSSASGRPLEYAYNKWNETTQEYELTEREVYTYDSSYEHVSQYFASMPYMITKYDADGRVVTHTVYEYDCTKVFEPYTRTAIIYDSDQDDASIIGKNESKWKRTRVMEELVDYTYENGNYVPVTRETCAWNFDTFHTEYCQISSLTEEWDGSAWKEASREEFLMSPEYHTHHTPMELYYEKKTLDWLSPERVNGDLEGYTLLLNHVPFKTFETSERIFELKDIPDGVHTFNVLANYDDGEANISDPVEVKCSGFSGIEGIEAESEGLQINGTTISVQGAEIITVCDVNGIVLKSSHGSSIDLADIHSTIVAVMAEGDSIGKQTFKIFVR